MRPTSSPRPAWRTLAALALALLAAFPLPGCTPRAERRPEPACTEAVQSLVPGVRLCALARPAVRYSGHPYHPDSDRVLVGPLSENEGRPALRVESYRVYSVEHVFLTLDLETGRIVRDEHRTGGAPDVLETLEDAPPQADRRKALLAEMRAVVALVEAGGTAGPHANAPHPELGSARRFLDAYLGRVRVGSAPEDSSHREPTDRAADPAPTIELFGREGCVHCARAKRFLEAYARRNPRVRIVVHDVDRDEEARARLETLAVSEASAPVAVPALRVRDRWIVGFDDEARVEARLDAILSERPADRAASAPEVTGGVCPPDAERACREDTEGEAASVRTVDVPGLGAIDPERVGLPVFTLVLGLVDGFNPCATWVLLFLLAMLVNVHDRLRMFLVAGVFLLVSGLVYFAFMAAWLGFFAVLGATRPLQVALGLLALAVGAVHVKDFFAFRKGISLSIPESAKPGIYARVRRIVRAESLGAALVSATVLAVGVNVVELVCTAGLPVVYTQVLSAHSLGAVERYGYLALYNVAYMLDDAVLLAIALLTMSKTKLDEKGGRVLKLVSGLVLVGLGLVLVLRPDWLSFGS